MTPNDLVDQLLAGGLDPGEQEARLALFRGVLDSWRQVSADLPERAWWVPGRLEVFGTHTDYAGGRTLVAAVPRGFAVAARARPDTVVRVVDARQGDTVTIDLAAPGAALTGWRNYVDVAARRLARNFPDRGLGADIVLASDLPRASGMSSSSAMVVGVASALVCAGRLRHTTRWQANIHSPLDEASYYACIENGHRFEGLDGDGGVGTHGGSEDHAAIVEGRPDRVLAFAFVPPRAIGLATMPEAWRFVLAPSGVRANKTGGAQAAYNRLSDSAAALLDLWNRQTAVPASSLAAALQSGPGAADRLRALAGDLTDRLDHFVREDARIPPALQAFESADAVALGQLSAESQADAEHLLGNQVPETSALVRTARTRGAFAAASFGAGFGGAVWALVEAGRAADFARQWHAGAFVMRPGLPLTELPTK